MMDDFDIAELRRIGDVMLGGYAVTSNINRITCDCQKCHRPARHTATSRSPLAGRLLERHLCDEHFLIFTEFFPDGTVGAGNLSPVRDRIRPAVKRP